MPAVQQCPGCLKTFTSQAAHLSQTTNPLCQRIANIRRSHRHSHSVTQRPLSSNSRLPLKLRGSSTSPQDGPLSSLPSPHSPLIPQNPSPTTSSQSTSRSSSVSIPDNDADEEEIIDDSLAEKDLMGWEPPVGENCGSETGSNDPRESHSPEPPEDTHPEDVRQRAWTIPKVVRFPNSRAGQPVGTALPTHEAYATSLANPSSTNPYMPFASKIDWEVAQWAKLRGPSATSFGELLKIDGVRRLRSVALFRIY